MTKGQLGKKANDYRNSGQIEKAIDAYEAYAKVCAEEGDEKAVAGAYHMAGVASTEGIKKAGDDYFNRALAYYKKAKDIYTKLHDEYDLGRVLRDEAISYSHIGDMQSAYPLFAESVAKTEKTEYVADTAITLDKWGLALLKDEKIAEAEEKMRKALLMLEDTQSWFYWATTLLDLSRVLFIRKQYADAATYLHQSESIYVNHYTEEAHPRRLAEIYLMLEAVYVQLAEQNLQLLEPQAREVVTDGMKKLLTSK